MQTTTIQRWGNSLAVRLPKVAVEGLSEGERVRIVKKRGALVLIPQRREIPPLDALLRASPAKRIQRRMGWGNDIGKEKI